MNLADSNDQFDANPLGFIGTAIPVDSFDVKLAVVLTFFCEERSMPAIYDRSIATGRENYT
jgi:hypothetical protein